MTASRGCWRSPRDFPAVRRGDVAGAGRTRCSRVLTSSAAWSARPPTASGCNRSTQRPMRRPTAGMPGTAPFVRGATAAGIGWRLGHPPAPSTRRSRARQCRDPRGPRGRCDLDRSCASTAPTAAAAGSRARRRAPRPRDRSGLDAGAAFAPAATGAAGAGAPTAASTRASLRADLNADPLGAAVAGAALDPAAGLAAAVALARRGRGRLARHGHVLLADGRPYHAGGASEAQELAFAVATGIAYLRALVERRHAGRAAARPDRRSRSPSMPTSSSRWPSSARCAGSGAGCSRSPARQAAMPALRLHAETATRMLTRRDPQVNILRGTVGDVRGRRRRCHQHHRPAVRPRAGPARRRSPGASPATPSSSCSRRAHLGRVIDPAGGSWFVERLTEELAARAWSLVQEVERRGGMLPALREGWPQEQVAASRGRRGDATSPRRRAADHRGVRVRRPARAGRAGAGALAARRRATGADRADSRRSGWPQASSGCGRASDAILAATGERPRVFLAPSAAQDEFAARADLRPQSVRRPAASPRSPARRLALARGGRPRLSRQRRAAGRDLLERRQLRDSWPSAAARALKHAHAARRLSHGPARRGAARGLAGGRASTSSSRPAATCWRLLERAHGGRAAGGTA